MLASSVHSGMPLLFNFDVGRKSIDVVTKFAHLPAMPFKGKRKTLILTWDSILDLPWRWIEHWAALVVSWLRLVLLTWSCRVRVPLVSGLFYLSPCLTLMPWSSLSSTQSNEEVFHRIPRRGCKPSVSGDLARLASCYSRPSLATIIVVHPKG